ncbi:hypothetical protein RO21_10830 [[Actinobacillus] muris]|uniref:Uncharacterized protein n=1 Tax=Muribacter muris TaxID=67855 RepID=A0A0J5S170_9PAST|nr:hypothetical protein RO21_10830 [[Actinobacillus] muris] [Muribacter muris]
MLPLKKFKRRMGDLNGVIASPSFKIAPICKFKAFTNVLKLNGAIIYRITPSSAQRRFEGVLR